MAIKKIPIGQFLELAKTHPVFDVRSPGEFLHAHIPNAYSLPLFTDEERKVVGTSYKQQGKKTAVKLGLDFFGHRMRSMVETVEKISGDHRGQADQDKGGEPVNSNTVLVHCWRGGMRSAGVAWLLDLYGFEVYSLVGGYKAFRNHVLDQFNRDLNIQLLGGYTGSGKTDVLHQLKQKKLQVIDLERMANHKGSAFGSMGEPPQPSQEMFENLLATKLDELNSSEIVWVEDESQRIGQLNIPNAFWETMRTKVVCFLNIPMQQRLSYIVNNYGLHDKEKLVNAIIRIQKRLGPLETKTAIGFLVENNYAGCFEILLAYYDKLYTKSLQKRDNLDKLLLKIDCEQVDANINTEKLLSSCVTVNA